MYYISRFPLFEQLWFKDRHRYHRAGHQPTIHSVGFGRMSTNLPRHMISIIFFLSLSLFVFVKIVHKR